MKEKFPLKRTFIIESDEEYAKFKKLLDKSGYELKETPRSKGEGREDYEIMEKGEDQRDYQGGLNCYEENPMLEIVDGTGLEKITEKFMALTLTKDSAQTRAKMDAHALFCDMKDIAGAEE